MQKRNAGSVDLTNGSIPGGILAFTIPLFLGQLLQQFYNMVDAWVIGNFADNNAFAAVSSTGTIVFLIIGFLQALPPAAASSSPATSVPRMEKMSPKLFIPTF